MNEILEALQKIKDLCNKENCFTCQFRYDIYDCPSKPFYTCNVADLCAELDEYPKDWKMDRIKEVLERVEPSETE